MPEVIGPIVAFLSSGPGIALGTAASLAGTGVELAKSLSTPSAPSTPQPTPEQIAQQTATANAPKLAAIGSQFPSLQEQVGGALAPESLATFAGRNAGLPGEPNLTQQALQAWLGLPGGSSSGSGSSVPMVPPPELPSHSGGELATFPTESTPNYQGLSGGFV